MDIGIGLPNTVKGIDRDGIVEWAKRAEAAGFSTLGTLDRIVYSNYESLIALAAAAAVTERIGLATDILIAPLRHPGTALLAKQAATIDHLSNGRLVLGVSAGDREDDYEVVGVDYRRRGRILDEQLEELASIWRGDRGIGPAPANGERPTLLIGGRSDKAIARAARVGDGWTMGGATPDVFAECLEKLRAQWSDAGRDGEPRTMALFYFALGDRADQDAREGLGDYYEAYLGEVAEHVIAGAAKSADAVRERVKAFEDAGAGEVICFPASADPGQVELLANVLL